ncbi:MAG: DUF4350 domain-containing protein [Gammaproteobacteria bacterium]
MHINKKMQRQLTVQNSLFTIALLCAASLIAWLSTQYSIESDWTASQRNSLSTSSALLLETLDEPVHITAFARENKLLKSQINDIINRYQRNKNDISLKFVNPDAEPDRIRELGITHEGELMIAYKGRREKVSQLSEQAITNVLTDLARQHQTSIQFLTGHGEREPKSEANHSLGNFSNVLKQKGMSLEALNLAATHTIPAETGLLVIASPQTALLDGEVNLILAYLKQGGNLLWLVEPGEYSELERLSDYLSIEFLPGTVVDTASQKLGIDNPAFVLVPDYPPHPVTKSMDSLTLFPESVAIQTVESDNWLVKPILSTPIRTWTETDASTSDVEYDANSNEQKGPFDIGLALQRRPGESADRVLKNTAQRIIVIGDGDFLANTYLGNAGNLDLGLNVFNWLSQNDTLIKIPARVENDTQLALGQVAQTVIAFGFLFALPLALLACGVFIWWKRRRL